MSRNGRILLNTATGVSLALCASLLGVWGISHVVEIVFREFGRDGARWEVAARGGRFSFDNLPQRRTENRWVREEGERWNDGRTARRAEVESLKAASDAAESKMDDAVRRRDPRFDGFVTTFKAAEAAWLRARFATPAPTTVPFTPYAERTIPIVPLAAAASILPGARWWHRRRARNAGRRVASSRAGAPPAATTSGQRRNVARNAGHYLPPPPPDPAREGK